MSNELAGKWVYLGFDGTETPMKQLEPVDYPALLTWVEKEAPHLSIPQQVGLCMQHSRGKADPNILAERLKAIRSINELFASIKSEI